MSPFHLTPSGRWAEDKPAPVETPRPAAPTFDVFLIHRYTHTEDRVDCPFCAPPPPAPLPWGVLDEIALR